MTGNTKMLTLRVEVTIPYGGKRPQRVRVVAKDRGALLFPYRRKFASIPLYKARWRRLPGNLWRNEQAMTVPVDMAKLLSYRNLALQLYCLRGSDVKHKGVFNFRRLMAKQQQQDDEVFLAMHYSATCWWHCLARWCRGCCKAAEDEVVPVPVVVEGGGGGDECGCCTREGSLDYMWRGVPASGTPALSQATPLASVTAPVPHAPPIPTGAKEEQLVPLPLPRPIRFPDSGTVFPQLIREHDLLAAEVGTRRQTEEGKREAHRHHGMRRHRRLALGLVGSLAVATGTLLARHEATPSVHWMLCGVAVLFLLAYACAHVRVRRRRQRDGR